MKINFKQIEAFVWVADLGSFWQAGQRLRTTQPNISTRVSNLEETLGVKLFERDAGSVKLTDHGKGLLKEARAVLRSADAFVESAGQTHLTETLIRIGITEMIVHTWLPQFLAEAKQQFPELNIELTVDLSANLKPALHSRSIDLAFQNGPFMRKTSGSKELGTYPYIWVGTPDQSIFKVAEPTIEDMRSVPILTLGRETLQYEELQAHFGGSKKRGANLMPSNSMSPTLQMTLAGIGVSALPAAMLVDPIRTGKLRVINYPWLPSPLSFLARFDTNTTPLVVDRVANLASTVAITYLKQLPSI